MAPSRRTVLTRAGVAAGAVAGAAGLAYGMSRMVTRPVRRDDPNAGDAFALEGVSESFVDSFDGARLRVVSRGTGPTILLSHGVMLTSRVWVQQFREWPELGYRVVAFDHRGHGGSTVGTEGHSVEHLARDILAVLEHHDLRDVLLVGHSMGGFAVQMFAARHADIARERVTALGLLSTAARSPVIGGLPRARTALAALSARGPDIGEMFRRPSLGFALARASLGRDAQASHVELTRELLASTSHETRRDAVAGILRFDIEAELPRIDRPTLVLVGSADVLTPPAEARRIARGIPGARLEVIPRAGHMLMLERPDVLRTVLLGWFDARRAAAAQPPITQPPITQPPIAAEGRMRRGPR